VKALADLSGEVFNVGGGVRIGLIDAIESIQELTGRALELRHLPAQDGDVRDTGPDTERAKRMLGYAPATSFADGLRAEFEWIASARDAASRSGEVRR
jgi:nucleoside-diphosphate-sugar epimerase